MVSIMEMAYCVACELLFIHKQIMNSNFGQHWTSGDYDNYNAGQGIGIS